jgi:hypothetical protein
LLKNVSLLRKSHAIPSKATVVQSFVTLVVTLRRRRYGMLGLELTTVA